MTNFKQAFEVMKKDFETIQSTGETKAYFLDLIAHRNISDKIANTYNVRHESPQILVISNGKCIYDASHSGISYEEVVEQL